MYRKYKVRARLVSDGSWVSLTDWLEPEQKDATFLWFFKYKELVYDYQEMKFCKKKAIDLAKNTIDPEYQDIIVECATLQDNERESWFETQTIWQNGKWV